MREKITVVDLFCGIGTCEQALKELKIPYELLACAEIDKYANISRHALHGEDNNLGDIIKIESIPKCDLLMFSAPCQSVSAAGKNTGLQEGSGTASSLIWEVKRLLLKAKEDNCLPKSIVMENVKNLVSKRYISEFNKWLDLLSSLGYTNYWQILNAKDYCIPQNRERVFVVSFLGEHKPYEFPEKRELRLRLKDMLDNEVDEKFYLTERALESLGKSSYNQEKLRLQDSNSIHRTVCQRDWKSPSCVLVGNLFGGKWSKLFKMGRRVYSTSGLAPCQHTNGGGNLETKIIDDTYKNREPRKYADISPTIRSKSYDFKVVAGKVQPVNHNYKADGETRHEHIEFRKDELSGAVIAKNDNHFVMAVAMRGRNPDNPSDRTTGIKTQQRLEPNTLGLTNTITSVQKDNLMLESDCENKYEIPDTARIRKLCPWECMRLQGWKDTEINKIREAQISNTQMYRQAGNGICLTVLIAVFGELFGVAYANILDNWSYKNT